MKRRKFIYHSGLAIIGSGVLVQCKSKSPTASILPGVPSFDLKEITIDTLQSGYKSGKWNIETVTQWYLSRIQAIDKNGPKLNAVIEINPDAIAIARQLDIEYKSGKIRGPLHGIPILIKDNIDTADQMMTTAGSLALIGNKATQDAFIVKKLREAGAVLLGKTNLSEWANFRSSRSSSGWSSRGGQTLNPYVLDHSPCGSSSGSGAAAAASLCAIAIGTETDGSIACPASMNALVGIKPTVGLWSRSGIIPISSTQDTAGPMCRSVKDAAILLSALTGTDERDAITISSEGKTKKDYTTSLTMSSLKGKRFGLDTSFLKGHDKIDRLLNNTIDQMKTAGAEIVEVDFVNANRDLGDAEFIVLKYEFKAGLNKYLASAGIDSIKSLDDIIRYNESHESTAMPFFNQETLLACKDLGDLNTPEYKKALIGSYDKAKKTVDTLLQKYKLDALCGPATGPGWCIDLVNGDRWTGYGAYGIAAAAGYPSITVPMGYIHELPVGMSFMSTAWDEERLIQIGYAFEQLINARKEPTYLKNIGLQ